MPKIQESLTSIGKQIAICGRGQAGIQDFGRQLPAWRGKLFFTQIFIMPLIQFQDNSGYWIYLFQQIEFTSIFKDQAIFTLITKLRSTSPHPSGVFHPVPHIQYIDQPRMVNYNMGRYYAWSNLSQLIKGSIRRRFYTPKYQFKYIPPKVHTNMHLLPFEEWKANKIHTRSEFKFLLLAIGCFAYFFSKFVYQVLEDDDQGYYYHLRYPILSQSIVWIHADIVEFTNPFFEIMPKDRYEVAQIYPRLYELIFNPKKKIEESDRKALQLRQAIQEYDKSHQ